MIAKKNQLPLLFLRKKMLRIGLIDVDSKIPMKILDKEGEKCMFQKD
jgi:hypothetical protein